MEYSEKIRQSRKDKDLNSLSDIDLIYTVIGDRKAAESIYNLAGNELNNMFKLTPIDLMQIEGVTYKKASRIAAAMEISKRRALSVSEKRTVIRCSKDGYACMHPILADLPHEELWIILMNGSAKVVNKIKINQGGIGETLADIRLILKSAITSLATGIILSHNHPSGNPKPSMSDDRLTHKLYKAAKIMDISLLDHIIICDGSYYSYADEGKLISNEDRI